MLGEILFGTGLIELLQSLPPAFDKIFLILTTLGEDFVFTALIAAGYWCLNKKAAVIAVYVLLLSGYLNFFLKLGLRMERPPPEYRIVGKEEITYGFPSGHTQNVVTFWSWIWLNIRRVWMALVSITVISVVGLSRIYLGVHYPIDVIGGIMIGVLFSVLSFKLGRMISMRFKDPYGLLNRAVPILAIFLFVVSYLISPDIARGGDHSATLGPLLGMPIGVMLEMKYVNFSTEVSPRTKILRVLIGFGFVIGLMLGLPKILPGIIRWAIITFAAAFLVPLIFKSIKR